MRSWAIYQFVSSQIYLYLHTVYLSDMRRYRKRYFFREKMPQKNMLGIIYNCSPTHTQFYGVILILMKNTNNNNTQKERYRYIGRYTVHAFFLLILVIKH